MKPSLKWLAQKHLSREIQKGHGISGHDSIEDAQACMDLVKLKCERGPKWGTTEAAGESIFKRLLRTKAWLGGRTEGKRGVIVDHGSPEKSYGAMATHCIGCETDLEVVDGIKRAVLGDPDGKVIPGAGVEFTWARFRELENLRGWTSDNRQQSSTSSNFTPSHGSSNNPSGSALKLGTAVSKTIQHIKAVREFLPPCTLLIVYSGTGDPREMHRLHEMQRTFKSEYTSKKWDELSVKWTDHEEQALRNACRRAREGVGFVTVV